MSNIDSILAKLSPQEREALEGFIGAEAEKHSEELVAWERKRAHYQNRVDEARARLQDRPCGARARAVIDAEDALIRATDPERYAEMVMCGQASWQEAIHDEVDSPEWHGVDDPEWDDRPDSYRLPCDC